MPDQVPCRRVLHRSPWVHSQLEGLDVYPNGLVVRIDTRFRGPLSLDQQRQIGSQVMAFTVEDAVNHDGPHVRFQLPSSYRVEGLQTDGDMAEGISWAPRGSAGLWRLSYWLPCAVGEWVPAEYRFDWPSADIAASWRIDWLIIQKARTEIQQLWPTDDGPVASYIAPV